MGEDYGTKSGTEKKKGKKILACVGAVVFLATALLVVFFAPKGKTESIADLKAPAPSQSPVVPDPSPVSSGIPATAEVPDDTPVAPPFIFENNADIFMASGENVITLGSRQSLSGCYKEMNCALSENNRYLYYIEDTDISTGMGKLKQAPTDAVSSPITVEDGVCAAQVSPDGSLMYIKNIRGVAGELYLYKGGKSSLVESNVLPIYFDFSKSASCISYIVQESAGTFALYVKRNDEEPKLVTRVTAEVSIDDGVNISNIGCVVPFDSGQVLYSLEKNYNMQLYFYDYSGKTETICSDGYVIRTYADGSFLYADTAKNNLWYKSPRTVAVNITGNYSYTRFSEETDRFLLMEHLGDSLDGSRVMMHEVDENREKIAISVGDDSIFEINSRFDCVVYENKGVLYASRKTNDGWMETDLFEAPEGGIAAGSKSGIVARFDGAGDNLYFFDEYNCGPLYRYSLKDGKTEKLIDRVESIYVFDKTAYAHAAGDKLHMIEGGIVKMVSEGVRNVKETRGGAFLITGGAFKYISDSSIIGGKKNSFTKEASLTGSISFKPPLEKDLITALEVLSDEADYCLYKLGVYRIKTEELIDINDAITVAQKLAGREDISEAERGILTYMAEGFKAYNAKDRRTAKTSLQKAVDAYERYINSADS